VRRRRRSQKYESSAALAIYAQLNGRIRRLLVNIRGCELRRPNPAFLSI